MACPLYSLGGNWGKFLEGKVEELKKDCYGQSELKLMLEELNTSLNNWEWKIESMSGSICKC